MSVECALAWVILFAIMVWGLAIYGAFQLFG